MVKNVMQKTLIVLGGVFLAIGLFWPWLGKLPIGRLPGDIVIDRPNLKIYFPITTMIIISIIVSIVSRFFRK
jgi:hypothetical protein